MGTSVSSHLTPEPERRLWLVLENMKSAVDRADLRAAGLTAFAAAELVLFAAGAGWLSVATRALLTAALPLGLIALYPLPGTPKPLPLLDAGRAKPTLDDNMVAVEDLAKYTHGELIHKLDKYLGGGITSTQYHEDIVGQIAIHARIAARKQRLLKALFVVVGLAQAGLLGIFLSIMA